jgi:2-polyprenyl-3-methyl-5-hydroxy-6-metoxy-1,4-benzoquinol methylase
MFFNALGQRRCAPEIMDQPGLDPHQHRRALRGLARINRVSASDRILWGRIAALARATPGHALRILDVATGAGDVPIRLWRRAQRAGLSIEICGADVSATAVEHARQNAQRVGAAVEFIHIDVVHGELPDGFDVITSSLFLHHLDDEQAVALLRKMARAASRCVLINDLLRCRMGYLAAWFGTRLLTVSPVVRADGPASVEAAFTMGEAQSLAERAGLAGATIEWRWPWRFLLAWKASVEA